MINSVWDVQGITYENIKKDTLVNALHDHTLTWYITYSSNHSNKGIAAVQDVLKKEFGRSKSEAQSVIRFNEIVMMPSETLWDLDQRLKSSIREANMILTDDQHHAWFVASLAPHLRIALSQQKISSQAKALEAAM